MTVRQIKLVCAHGIQDGTPDLVERFRLIRSMSGYAWVPTIRGHSRTQQLRGDELQVYPLASEPDEDKPLRNRYPARCERCGRTLPLRNENLQALLNASAAGGHDTLLLDNFR